MRAGMESPGRVGARSGAIEQAAVTSPLDAFNIMPAGPAQTLALARLAALGVRTALCRTVAELARIGGGA
jgi:ABC-type transporter Mla maintaining outer membrane lipid asymmetry permease subunit MlaE